MDSHRHPQSNPYSDQTWSDLYMLLTPYVKTLVYNSDVPDWYGQEYDVVKDIVQGTIEHILTYLAKVERGEASPIGSLRHFSKKTALHYYLDLRRKEIRLFRPEMEDEADNVEGPLARFERLGGTYDPLKTRLNALMLAESLVPAARLMKTIARKQRIALLIDLARLSDFDEETTPLEYAFFQVGIRLRDYQGSRPTEKRLKTRHASSLCVAYKKWHLLARTHLRKSDFVA